MSKPHILVSGASIAGPALAYWLVRAGCKVTVVERAPTLRTAGQGIDVRDTARDVIKQMGLFDIIRERSSGEEGTEIIGRNSNVLARFAVDLESGKGESFTCDIEILRGELAGILYDATKDDVEYVFGDMVENLEENEKGVRVTFAGSTPQATFDAVVAADGLGSKIRAMTFGRDAAKVKSLNSYVAYFSIPKGKGDTMWSRAHWIDGGRAIYLRPDHVGRTRAFLSTTTYDSSDSRLELYRKAIKQEIPEQKALLQDMFQDGDWETSRVLEGMHESTDFYLQHIAQIRMDQWTSGRVTVVGDAGYAPSPFTGMGTSLAFIGAYILAGEISEQLDDIPSALKSYERALRPYVDSVQSLPWGIPWIVNPQSWWGVRVHDSIVGVAGVLVGSRIGAVLHSVITKIIDILPSRNDDFKLPEYEAFKRQKEESGWSDEKN